jgi:4-hydroxy-tetrahydrodipicolinate synthase
MTLFTGVGVALVTLFDDRGRLDAKATAALATELVDAGMRAVVVAGSTGEAATLERDERIELLDAVRTAVDGAVPVIAGTGAPSSRQAARLTADAIAVGADGVLSLSPPGSAELESYYASIVAAAEGAPVLAYHFPVSSAPGIDVEQVPALTAAGVDGLKDSSGDPARLLRTLDRFDGWLYVGSSWLLAAAGPWGATGAILAVGNVEPRLAAAAFAGDVAAQRALTPVNERARGAPGVKAMLAERSGWSTVTRIGRV